MKAINLLLVEDNPQDLLLARKAIESCQHAINLHTVSDVQQARAYLERSEGFQFTEMPSIILLALTLGQGSSFELLRTIRMNPKWCYLPVIVMSSQRDWQDAKRFYAAGANSYVSKPSEFEDFGVMIQDMTGFWLETCVLPNQNYFSSGVA